MNPDIFSRTVWALSLAALGVALYFFANRLVLLRARSRKLGLETVTRGKPVLVYFTTPTCIPCKTVQRPAIQRLRTIMGDNLQVIEIDASTQPEIATHWGVLSVPTTYIIDEDGQPRHVNHGVASYEQLIRQMASLCTGV